MPTSSSPSSYLGGTFTACVFVAFYPATVAPTGFFSNGGLLGLASLLCASALAWTSFAINTDSHWIRRLVQLPITALVTFMVIWDAMCQVVTGWWWGF